MDCDHYMSDDSSPKEFYSDEEEQISKKIEKQEESEKPVNNLIDEEEFEKAYNTVFRPPQDKCVVLGEEINRPIIYVEIDENKSIIGCSEKEFIINVEEKKKKDKYFPFTKGVGIEKTQSKIGLKIKDNTSSKDKPSSDGINKLNISSRFKTTDYYTDEKGKKKKKKKKRKFKPDDIRKKIKARFHKVLRDILNKKLIKAGAKKNFNCLPQCFITDITIKTNNEVLYLTYEKLIEQSYNSEISSKRRTKDTDFKNYNKNIEVLNYLRENLEISEKSEFEKIKNMKYYDILKAFFMSKEFEDTLIMLYNKRETYGYIEEYAKKALTYVSFFAYNKKFNSNNNTIKISIDDEKNEEDDEEEEDKDSGYECE